MENDGSFPVIWPVPPHTLSKSFLPPEIGMVASERKSGSKGF
jgi:hypothetical protein